MGTYMLLKKGDKKSSVPYITYKPDMYGTLDVRFHLNFDEWRSSKVFSYQPDEIKEISVSFYDTPEESYTIQVVDKNKVRLLDGNNMPVPSFDSSQVKHYLTHYKKIHYEYVDAELSASQIDSIQKIKPNNNITVTDQNGKTKSVNIWKIAMPEDYKNSYNQVVKWNPEKGWCSINGAKEIEKFQYFSWDVLFKPLSFFKR